MTTTDTTTTSTSPAANARIQTLATGVTAQMIAEQVHLFYKPADGSATVSFQGRQSLFVDDQFHPLSSDYHVLQSAVADIAERCFSTATDPVTGADLSKVSVSGVMAIIKAAYDTLFNEDASATTTATAT